MTNKNTAGRSYDLDVVDFFYLSSGTLAFSGYPSAQYEIYVPAKANIYADGEKIGSVLLTLQPHFKRLDTTSPQKIGLETSDVIDIMPFKGRHITLKCLVEYRP